MRASKSSRRARGILVVLGVAAAAQCARRVLQGQDRRPDDRLHVGGGYDVYARLIARHLGKHIPGNPHVTPKNMEGAGSLRLANWLYNVANKNGTVFGTIGRGTGFDPLFGAKAAQFDGNKFNWIGSANDEVSVCVVWNGRTKITKFDDLLTMRADCRRHRRRRRHRPVPAHHQRRARHQDEDRHRLSGRQRRQSCAGARRGRRPLRLVVVERNLDPRVVDQGQEDHRADAALAREASRICPTFRSSPTSRRTTSNARSCA